MRSETAAMDGRAADCGVLASDGSVITCASAAVSGATEDTVHSIHRDGASPRHTVLERSR
jgi:hypothetical protein